MKRSQSQYEVVYIGSKIFKIILNMCLKMPKRYTYLILKDMIDLANKVSDYTRGAKSFEPTNQREAQIQVNYFIHANAALDALSGKINIFLQIPETLTYKDEQNKKNQGVTLNQLETISDYIQKERVLIQKSIEKIKSIFPKLIEKQAFY